MRLEQTYWMSYCFRSLGLYSPLYFCYCCSIWVPICLLCVHCIHFNLLFIRLNICQLLIHTTSCSLQPNNCHTISTTCCCSCASVAICAQITSVEIDKILKLISKGNFGNANTMSTQILTTNSRINTYWLLVGLSLFGFCRFECMQCKWLSLTILWPPPMPPPPRLLFPFF